jgi:hypothetical protein
MGGHVGAGQPIAGYVFISYVERSNLPMRMGMRRFIWLTNAFSKKPLREACPILTPIALPARARTHGTSVELSTARL